MSWQILNTVLGIASNMFIHPDTRVSVRSSRSAEVRLSSSLICDMVGLDSAAAGLSVAAFVSTFFFFAYLRRKKVVLITLVDLYQQSLWGVLHPKRTSPIRLGKESQS